MGRGGEEDLGFDPRAARALEAVGRGGAGPDSGAHFALWRLRGEQALGDEGGSRKPGPADCSGPTVVRMGRKEARPGGGGSGGEEVGGFSVNYEDGAHGIHGGGQNWVTGRRRGRLGAGEQKEASGLHTPSAAPTH